MHSTNAAAYGEFDRRTPSTPAALACRHPTACAGIGRRRRVPVEREAESIIRKYSNHISLPILMQKEEWDKDKKEKVEGKERVSVAKGNLDLGKLESEAEKKQHEETENQYKELVKTMKTALADKAKDVRVTFRPDS